MALQKTSSESGDSQDSNLAQLSGKQMQEKQRLLLETLIIELLPICLDKAVLGDSLTAVKKLLTDGQYECEL
jgi:hypothetical protein